jgi:putative transposase
MPFLVKAIQVDGGSEFEAAFEEECQKRNIRLFVLPPNSPKLNGYVERAQ